MTTAPIVQQPARTWQVSNEAKALLEKFPSGPVPAGWPRTRQDRAAVEDRMTTAPFRAGDTDARCHRKLSLQAVLDWLELYPGQSWQQRWDATGAGRDGRRDWRLQLIADLDAAGLMGQRRDYVRKVLGMGLIQLIGGDYVRPSLGWLMATSSPLSVANEMAKVRDPHGIAELRAARLDNTVGDSTMLPAIEKVALIMAAKGGSVRDVTVADCLESMRISREVFPGPARSSRHSPVFYQLLHSIGLFPADAPPTVRMFSPLFAGQLPFEQLVDRYQVTCRPIRDLLVDYLRERQPAIDYNTLTALATALVLWFWKDLERHHPGIDESAPASSVPRQPPGRSSKPPSSVTAPPMSSSRCAASISILPNGLSTTRQGGDHGPFRPRSAPLTSSTRRCAHGPTHPRPAAGPADPRAGRRLGTQSRRSTPGNGREDPPRRDLHRRWHHVAGGPARPPLTPGLGRRTGHRRAPRLDPRGRQHVLGLGHRRGATHDRGQGRGTDRTVAPQPDPIPDTGRRRTGPAAANPTVENGRRTPAGHLPELADVLSAIVCRIRNPDGSVPLVVAYDHHEKIWNPPMPLLFQRTIGLETRPIPISGIRTLLSDALARAGLTSTSGKPLDFAPTTSEGSSPPTPS